MCTCCNSFFITSHKQSKLLFTAPPPYTSSTHTTGNITKEKVYDTQPENFKTKCSVVKGKLEFFTEKFYLKVKFKMFFNVFKYNYFYTCPLKN